MGGTYVEHDEAIATVAAERYLLGELSSTEREDFEEHYFSCPICAEGIRDLARLTGGVRAGLGAREDAAEKGRTKQRTFAPLDAVRLWLARPLAGWAAACGMLLVATGAGVQTIAMRRQLQPAAVQAFVLYPETRGEAAVVTADRTAQFALLEFDVPGADGMLDWKLTRTDTDKAVNRGSVAAPPHGASLKLVIPGSSLTPAEYRLDIARASVARPAWSFRFQVRGAAN